MGNNMKFVLLALVGTAVAIRGKADPPSSGYFGADEDDVMNNIFNHYAVEVANAAGQKTGHKVLYKEGCQKACAEIMLVTKQLSEAIWSPTWVNSSLEPGLHTT